MWDVAIAGAGISGLTCALALQEAGYRVIVVDKSKGVGGRAATRRLENTWVDHGAPTLSRNLEDEAQYGTYVTTLLEKSLIQPWPAAQIYRAAVHQGRWHLDKCEASGFVQDYAAPAGMTAIAKALTDNLDICRAQRVTKVQLDSQQSYWQIATEATAKDLPITLRARALVLAMPAPQALDLCTPLLEAGIDPSAIAALKNVRFDPCITTMAGYRSGENPFWSELCCQEDPIIQRILCDLHKRPIPEVEHGETWFVIHSTPAFAAQHLHESDLTALGQQILDHLGQVYRPWMAQPFAFQVHRWRYAIASGGYPGDPLSANMSLPLWICGDWCTGNKIQDAFEVGLDVAQRIHHQLSV